MQKMTLAEVNDPDTCAFDQVFFSELQCMHHMT